MPLGICSETVCLAFSQHLCCVKFEVRRLHRNPPLHDERLSIVNAFRNGNLGFWLSRNLVLRSAVPRLGLFQVRRSSEYVGYQSGMPGSPERRARKLLGLAALNLSELDRPERADRLGQPLDLVPHVVDRLKQIRCVRLRHLDHHQVGGRCSQSEQHTVGVERSALLAGRLLGKSRVQLVVPPHRSCPTWQQPEERRCRRALRQNTVAQLSKCARSGDPPLQQLQDQLRVRAGRGRAQTGQLSGNPVLNPLQTEGGSILDVHVVAMGILGAEQQVQE
mmetsp:Transcript_28586/g.63060  ORF Transcript_28586/g.63060 Transcript_28586/m.63060 type:complete len:277 (-) Transcript_28586:767-1597(-)